ncbi:MAG TPA: hypothetical protein VL017_00365, partial [Devosia sp.]|nr:hypothetical protein [Devosia sp.]
MLGAETRERETGAVALPASPALRAAPALPLRPAATGPASGLFDAAASRRLFVLLPFAAIAGLIAYAALPMEPMPEALVAVAAGLVLLVLLLRRAAALPLAALLLAAWIGFCLLPLHGLWFGTSMLTRPAYGLYEARVEEIVSATSESRRIVVSSLVPVADDRAVDIARAR